MNAIKLSAFSGQQLAQVDNPDPFAPPVWRSPVLHTPVWIIAVVQLLRTLGLLVRFVARHPVFDLTVAALYGSWRLLGWPGPAVVVTVVVAGLVLWQGRWPVSYARLVSVP